MSAATCIDRNSIATHPAKEYLKALFSETDIVCLTFIHATKKYKSGGAVTENIFWPMADVITDEKVALLTRLNDEFHVYISMAPFKIGSQNRTKANIADVRHVFIDADENGDAVLANVKSAVAEGDIPAPTIIVQSSPHKYQFVWNVTGFTIPEQEALNRTLQQKFGGDPQATDAARVLRIPGFRNIKPKYSEPKPVAEIVEYNEPPFMGITFRDFQIPLTSEPDNTVHPIASDAVVQQSIEFLEAAMDAASVSYSRKVWEGSGGAFKFPLALCPWRENHENGGESDAMAFVQPSGAFGFKCLHAHCADKTWGNFRAHLESLAGRKLSFKVKGKTKLSDVTAPASAESGNNPPSAAGDYTKTHKKTEAAPTLPAEMIAHTADKVKPRKLKWLWVDRVSANKITLYAGNPDNGKSLAAIDLVARVTAKMNFSDCVNTLPPSEVLMLLGEDDEDDTAVPRLMSAGADLTKVHFPEGVQRPNVSDNSEVRLDIDLPALEAYLDKHPAIRLIVIDPISSYLGNVNMIAEQSVRSVLNPLRLMAMRRNVAVLFVMHLNKKSELDAISRVGGAMAFIGVARSAWLFIRDASTEEGEVKDSFTMCRMKSNLTASKGGGISYHITARPVMTDDGEVFAPYIVWGEKINKSADDSLGRTASKHDGPGRPKGTDTTLQGAIAWLQYALQDGQPQSSKVLRKNASEEANFSWTTLRRAQQALGIKPYQQKGGKVGTWVWELPPMNATVAVIASAKAQDEPAETDAAEVGSTQEFELK